MYFFFFFFTVYHLYSNSLTLIPDFNPKLTASSTPNLEFEATKKKEQVFPFGWGFRARKPGTSRLTRKPIPVQEEEGAEGAKYPHGVTLRSDDELGEPRAVGLPEVPVRPTRRVLLFVRDLRGEGSAFWGENRCWECQLLVTY